VQLPHRGGRFKRSRSSANFAANRSCGCSRDTTVARPRMHASDIDPVEAERVVGRSHHLSPIASPLARARRRSTARWKWRARSSIARLALARRRWPAMARSHAASTHDAARVQAIMPSIRCPGHYASADIGRLLKQANSEAIGLSPAIARLAVSARRAVYPLVYPFGRSKSGLRVSAEARTR